MTPSKTEIECYECGRLKTRLIWNSRCVTCTLQKLEANLEENDYLRDQLAALEEDNERLKVRVTELEEGIASNINGLGVNKHMEKGTT